MPGMNRRMFFEQYVYEIEKDFQSPEGAASTWAPGQPAIWGDEAHKIEMGDTAFIGALALSPDESLLAVGVNCDVHLYSLPAFELVDKLTGSEGKIDKLVFQPLCEGAFPGLPLLVSETDTWGHCVMNIWQLDRGWLGSGQTAPAPSPNMAETALNMDISGVRSSLVGTIQDATPDSLTRRSLQHRRELKARISDFTPNGKYMFIRTGERNPPLKYDGVFRTVMYDLSTITALKELPGDASGITSPNSKLIASACRDGTVKIWDIESGACKHVIGPLTRCMWECAWAPDSTYIASGGDSGTVFVHKVELDGSDPEEISRHKVKSDVKRSEFMSRYRSLGDAVRALQWSPDGQAIALGAGHALFALWNPWTGEEFQKWEHKFPEENVAAAFAEVKTVQFVDGGKKVVFSHAEGSVEVYDIVKNAGWHFARAPKGNTSQCHAETGLFSYSSKRGLIVTCHPDGVVRVWKL